MQTDSVMIIVKHTSVIRQTTH